MSFGRLLLGRKWLNYLPTVLVISGIVYLSLADGVHPSDSYFFPYRDKVAHFCMYAGLVSVLYFDLSRRYAVLPGRMNLFIFTWLLPVLFGGTMELLQKYLTVTRTAEWGDFLANSVGVTCGVVVGIRLIFPLVKRYGSGKNKNKKSPPFRSV